MVPVSGFWRMRRCCCCCWNDVVIAALVEATEDQDTVRMREKSIGAGGLLLWCLYADGGWMEIAFDFLFKKAMTSSSSRHAKRVCGEIIIIGDYCCAASSTTIPYYHNIVPMIIIFVVGRRSARPSFATFGISGLEF